MANKNKWFLFCFFVLTPLLGSSEHILVPISAAPRNFKELFLPLAKELVYRGHTFTLLSPFPPEKDAIYGIDEVFLQEGWPLLEQIWSTSMPDEEGRVSSEMVNSFKVMPLLKNLCRLLVNHPRVARDQSYDAIVLSMLMDDCGLGIAYRLQLPFIYFSTSSVPTSMVNNLRLPSPTAYCPVTTAYLSEDMNFWERTKNLCLTVMSTWMREYYFAEAMDTVLREELDGHMPSVLEIEKNVSIVMIQDHFSLRSHRPLTPNVIEVSGMQCRPPEALPKELEEWLTESDVGFIYVNLQPFFSSSRMSERYKKVFMKVFSELEQKVLWMWETEWMAADLPSNVRLTTSVPHQDLLGHRCIRVFLTHGDVHHVQDSSYHGVPIVGVPLTPGQYHYMKRVVDDGSGILIEWSSLTHGTLRDALLSIINTSSYQGKMKERRYITSDRIQDPLDTAVYWVEYVFRHGHCQHLKNSGVHLTWYQYRLVDITVFLLASLPVTICLLKMMFRRFCKLPRIRRKRKME